MKIKTMQTVLQEHLKEMEGHLKRMMKEQEVMRKERHMPYATDILNSLSHQIGYMNGAIEQTKNLLHMMEVSDGKFFSDRAKVDAHNKQMMEQLRSIVKRKK